MIAVAVSMSVILFMWSQGFLATTSEAASSQQQAQNVAAQSSITIENVQFSGGNTIKITVRNVGSVKVTTSNVYIDGELQTNVSGTGTIDPQGKQTITVTKSYSAGTTYIIKVTTTVGTFAETVVTAPA